jgi:hypothetical protein
MNLDFPNIMNVLKKKFDALFSTLHAFQSLYEESSRELAEDLMINLDFYEETEKKKIINELGIFFIRYIQKIFL